MSKQELIDHEMGPEVSGFMVFKEMKEKQSWNIQDAILLAHKYFLEYPPVKVLELIDLDNRTKERTRT